MFKAGKRCLSKLKLAFTAAAIAGFSAVSMGVANAQDSQDLQAMLDNQSRMIGCPASPPSEPSFYDGLTNNSTFVFFDEGLQHVRRLTLSKPLIIKAPAILRVVGVKTTPDFLKKHPTELHVSSVTSGLKIKGIKAQITCRF